MNDLVSTFTEVLEGRKVSIEVYAADTLPVHAMRMPDVEREASEYAELGLMGLAQQTQRVHGRRDMPGTLMSAGDLAIWSWRYLTVYASDGYSLIRGWGLSYKQWIYGTSHRAFRELTWPVPREVRQIMR